MNRLVDKQQADAEAGFSSALHKKWYLFTG